MFFFVVTLLQHNVRRVLFGLIFRLKDILIENGRSITAQLPICVYFYNTRRVRYTKQSFAAQLFGEALLTRWCLDLFALQLWLIEWCIQVASTVSDER